jgi:hypothetical protein
MAKAAMAPTAMAKAAVAKAAAKAGVAKAADRDDCVFAGYGLGVSFTRAVRRWKRGGAIRAHKAETKRGRCIDRYVCFSHVETYSLFLPTPGPDDDPCLCFPKLQSMVDRINKK